MAESNGPRRGRRVVVSLRTFLVILAAGCFVVDFLLVLSGAVGEEVAEELRLAGLACLSMSFLF
jgi:hypothetical protein